MEDRSVPELLLVQTTSDHREKLAEIARQAVERGWAACAQLQGPLQSVYRWDGAICQSEEYLLTLKSSRRCFADLQMLISQLHNYQLPEIVALPIAAVSQAYGQWWRDELQREGQPRNAP